MMDIEYDSQAFIDNVIAMHMISVSVMLSVVLKIAMLSYAFQLWYTLYPALCLAK